MPQPLRENPVTRFAQLLKTISIDEHNRSIGQTIAQQFNLEPSTAHYTIGFGLLITSGMRARNYISEASHPEAVGFNLQPGDRILSYLGGATSNTSLTDFHQSNHSNIRDVRSVGFNLPSLELGTLEGVSGVDRLLDAISALRDAIPELELPLELQWRLQQLLNKIEFDVKHYLLLGAEALKEDLEQFLGRFALAGFHQQVPEQHRTRFAELAWDLAIKLDVIVSMSGAAHNAIAFTHDTVLPVIKALLNGGQPE
ncbi:hypothetical protein [Deinococcus yunweiensis]|uniref:hypothetical protein n=1 Tax=Deinococcus yunweiensis TaxID=367282 RepID=UPI00398E5AEB